MSAVIFGPPQVVEQDPRTQEARQRGAAILCLDCAVPVNERGEPEVPAHPHKTYCQQSGAWVPG